MGDLWDDWAARYRSVGIDEHLITRDGEADPLAYHAATRRIVFVLKDSDNWAGGDLRDAMVPRPRGLMIMIARWAYGLLNEFPDFENADRPENQISAIRQVAAINLKKVTGGPTCPLRALEDSVRSDGSLLRRQLVALRPTVLVACGTWGPLLTLLGVGESSTAGDTIELSEPCPGALLVRMRHPTMASSRKTYDVLRQRVGTRLS